MHLPRFTYNRLASCFAAADLLRRHGTGAQLVAGGTDLFPRMKYGLLRPHIVISLKERIVNHPTLDDDGALRLDPFMTLADVIRSKAIQETYPALTDAASSVASWQIRNMASLGGNIFQENRCLYYNQSHTFQFVEPCLKRNGEICHHIPGAKNCTAVYMSDIVPVLISLKAVITLTDGQQTRSMPLDELYTGDGVRPLDKRQGEIMTEIRIPPKGNPFRMAFRKIAQRQGMEYATLSLAAVVQGEEYSGCCKEARITASAISQAPMRLKRTEVLLKGHAPTAELVRKAANLMAQEANPLPHHGHTVQYLRDCLEVIGRRTLSAAFGLASTGDRGI